MLLPELAVGMRRPGGGGGFRPPGMREIPEAPHRLRPTGRVVLLGCFAVRGERASGLLIGLAAALQPTVLLFAPLLWFTGRRRAALSTGVTFAALTVLAWAAMPHDSYTYWVHHMAGVGLGGKADGLANQSLHAGAAAAGAHRPGGDWSVPGAGRRGRRTRPAPRDHVRARRPAAPRRRDHRLRGHRGLTDDLAAPAAVRAARGRGPGRQTRLGPLRLAGRRDPRDDPPGEDDAEWRRRTRCGDNVVLLAALAAATLVPFLSRTSSYYQSPIPTQYSPPVPTRFRHIPLLPFLRRVLSRPNLLLGAAADPRHVRGVPEGPPRGDGRQQPGGPGEGGDTQPAPR